jgi:putative tricarboxylic transport membrane protein
MSPYRTGTYSGALSGLILLSACGGSGTQNYPDHTINIVVPFNKGASDSFARALAAAATTKLTAGFTVENVPGMDGTMGGASVLTRPADGYQLLEGIAGSLIIAPLVQGAPNVKWDAFEPVARIQGEEEFLYVKSTSSLRTIDDVVAKAKTSTGAVKFTGSVLAGVDSFVFQFLSKAANFKGTYDPYSGGGPAYDAFTAGKEDVYIGSYSDVAPDIDNGKVVPIAVASESRSVINMSVPTLKEKGWNVVLIEWRGIMAPKGTPADRIQVVADAFKASLATDSWKTYRDMNKTIDLFLGPSDFRTFLQSEEQRFSQLINDLGLKH